MACFDTAEISRSLNLYICMLPSNERDAALVRIKTARIGNENHSSLIVASPRDSIMIISRDKTQNVFSLARVTFEKTDCLRAVSPNWVIVNYSLAIISGGGCVRCIEKVDTNESQLVTRDSWARQVLNFFRSIDRPAKGFLSRYFSYQLRYAKRCPIFLEMPRASLRTTRFPLAAIRSAFMHTQSLKLRRWFANKTSASFKFCYTLQVSGHPRNNLMTDSSFLTVERLGDDEIWIPVATDANWETKYVWKLHVTVELFIMTWFYLTGSTVIPKFRTNITVPFCSPFSFFQISLSEGCNRTCVRS